MRGALSAEGRGQYSPVAFAPSTAIVGMSVECRLELWPESIEPSNTCAQLHAVWIFTMLMFTCGDVAQEPGAHRRAVWLRHLLRHAGRQPVTAHNLPHGSIAFHEAEEIIFLASYHPKPPTRANPLCRRIYLGL